jgi:hypothetical protein
MQILQIILLVSSDYSKYLGDVMVSMQVSSGVNCGMEHWPGQTKIYKDGIAVSLPNTHGINLVLRNKSKEWLSHEIVLCWSDMSPG